MSAKNHKTRCCVTGCINTLDNSPGLRFYRFPNATIFSFKQKKRNDWIAAVKRQNPDGTEWQPQNNTRICSKHFIGNEKSEDPRSPSYIPTIFPAVKDEAPVCETPGERCPKGRKRKSEAKPQPSSPCKSRKYSIELSNENVKFEGKNETKSINKMLILDHRNKIDQGVQVNFQDEENLRIDCESFTCNRYVYIDSNTDKHRSTSDVELQIYIPQIPTIKRLITKNPETVNRGCGCFPSAAKDIHSLLQFRTKFNGLTSLNEDREMLASAGVTRTVFQLLLKILQEVEEKIMSRENQLLLFLLKMKGGLSYCALSVLFGIRKSTATKIFISILKCLAVNAKHFVFWPRKEIIQSTMPDAFKGTYSNCRVIIDCMEFRVEQTLSVNSRVEFDSSCEKNLNLKVLVGYTPSGAISFISKCQSGQMADVQIAKSAKFLESLETNDVVLASKQLPQIKEKLDESGRGVLLVIPPVFCDSDFSSEQAEESYRAINLRKYIKQNMQRLRTFRILKKFNEEILPYREDIIFVCCVLVNLQLNVIKKLE